MEYLITITKLARGGGRSGAGVLGEHGLIVMSISHKKILHAIFCYILGEGMTSGIPRSPPD